MTRPTTLELGAVAPRSNPPNFAARKPQADFGAAFERAERQVREPEARDVRKPDAPEAERRSEEAHEAPADQQAARHAAEEPAAKPADAEARTEPTDEATEAPAEEAAAEDPALTPEATLALLIATGVPAGPVVAPAATEAGAEGVVQVAAIAGEAAAAVAADAASAEGPATDGQAGKPAAPAAGTLAAAARSLGLTGVQITTEAPATEAATDATQAPVNLGLALAEQADAEPVQAVQTGSITLAMASDEAEGLETLSPAASADDEVLTAEGPDAEATATPSLNGDKAVDGGPKDARPAADRAQGPARAEEVLPQVLKHAEALKSLQQNSIKLQLFPEHLGKMEIKVVSHQGVLSAQLTADSQHVKAMLEGQVASLQRSLQELGLKIDKVEVALASADLGGFDMGNPQGFADPRGQGSGHQQAPTSQGTAAGYGNWLANEPLADDPAAYAPTETITAIDYVA